MLHCTNFARLRFVAVMCQPNGQNQKCKDWSKAISKVSWFIAVVVVVVVVVDFIKCRIV